jgi:hypothetical protein
MPATWKTRTDTDNPSSKELPSIAPRAFYDQKEALADFGKRVKAGLPPNCKRADIALERSDPRPQGKVTNSVRDHHIWMDEDGIVHSNDMSGIVQI